MHLQTANCGGKKLVKCTIPNIKCTSSKLNDNAAVYIKSCFLLAYQCSRWFFCMAFDDFVEHMLEDINEPQLTKKKAKKAPRDILFSEHQSVSTNRQFLPQNLKFCLNRDIKVRQQKNKLCLSESAVGGGLQSFSVLHTKPTE